MKVLIIDDWVSNGLMIKGHLKPFNVETEIFTDPVQALYWCGRNDPDLILLDYEMPHMNAAEFLGRLRVDERLRAVPTFVITWDETKATRLRALEAGATDVLRKPIDNCEFVARVRNALESRALKGKLVRGSEIGV